LVDELGAALRAPAPILATDLWGRRVGCRRSALGDLIGGGAWFAHVLAFLLPHPARVVNGPVAQWLGGSDDANMGSSMRFRRGNLIGVIPVRRRRLRNAFAALGLLLLNVPAPWGAQGAQTAATLRVGAAAADLLASDSMIIAGGIHAGKVAGQEGRLRVVATVIQQGTNTIALAACDVLMLTRETLDPAIARAAAATGIPASHILVNCTHTHHAPSTMRVHDYGPDEVFTQRTQEAIVKAIVEAHQRLAESQFGFALGSEKEVGQNSRELLADGQIYWTGPRTNSVRPTGPFDPDLPVMVFRDPGQHIQALWFGHSTHSIGARQPGKRSPSIYGLAAQDLEAEHGGFWTFLEGASGSTHNLQLSGEACVNRIKLALTETLGQVRPRPVDRVAAIKRPFKFHVRHFDAEAEEQAVQRYCRKYLGAYGDQVVRVFRNMRAELASQQGQERETWVQVLRVGDVAWVGVPAEYFTQLGLDIKNRSPFRFTYIAELANDWIGYLPNLEGHKLGGYQVWTGLHSYAEPGTGERIADLAVTLLKELQP